MDTLRTVELAPGLSAGLSCRIDDLVAAAQDGFRLYEIFRLSGPEELLNYITVETIAQEDAQRPDWWPDVWWQGPWPLYWAMLVTRPPWRSSYFGRDDPDPEAWAASGLRIHALELVKERWPSILKMRERARESTDTLVQAEIALIDTHQHPNDIALLESKKSTHLIRHFRWNPLRDIPMMAYPLLAELLAHPGVGSFSLRGKGDWFAIKLACAEQITREGVIPPGESKIFSVRVLTNWSGKSQFNDDDDNRISLDTYPAWTQGVRFQSKGLEPGNLFLDTGGCGAKPLAMPISVSGTSM